MKRGAERQISKDDADDDIQEVPNPAQGFRKAEESALADRKIKGLPKRVMAGNSSLKAPSPSPVSSSEEPKPASAPKFGGFAGFGTSVATTTSSPFTFTPPTPALSSAIPSSQPTSSSSTFSGLLNPSSQTSSFSLTTPSVSSLASPATKAFASVIGHSASDSTSNTSTHTSSSFKKEDDDLAEVKYYKSLRGLNVSFLSAISKAVERDPFVDVIGLLESYKNLRTSVQTDYDKQSKSAKDGSTSEPSSGPRNMFKAAVMPAPPSNFSGFSAFSTSGSSGGGGFTPSIEKSSSVAKPGGYFFTASATSSSATSSQPQSAFGFASKTSGANPSSSLGPSSSAGNNQNPEGLKSAFSTDASKKDDVSVKHSLFSSGTSSAPSSTSTFGGFSMKAEESVGTKSSGNPFAPTSDASSIPKTSSSPFGTSVPNFFASSKVPSASDAPSTKPISAFAPVSSGFGVTTGPISSFSAGSSDTTTGNTTSVFGSSTAFGVADKPSSTSNPFTGFGGGSPPKTGFFGFGKGTGSIGNPVGFGFGNQAKDGEEDSSKSSTGFSFGAPPKSSESTASPPAEKSRNATPSENVEGTEEESSKLLPSTNHDEEGEGEEEEETTHAAKCKVYKMLKTDEKSEWKDMGVGMLRLKKHKTTDARRMLLRNSSTGKIIINFKFYTGFAPTAATKYVSFMGHDEGISRLFKLRMKTEEQASELKNALDREIAQAEGHAQ